MYRENNDNSVYNLEEYKIVIKKVDEIYNELTIHFVNVDIYYFRTVNNQYNLSLRYSYNSLFKSSWINCGMNLKLVYRK